MKKAILSLSILFITITSSANAHQNHCDFLPVNSMKIPTGLESFSSGGIDEVAFNRVIDKVSALYASVIKSKGGNLKLERLWNDPTVNASASRDHHNWLISMYGGLARYPIMTEDGFTLVMCHETGHQLGGFPEKITPTGEKDWAANEGQADYFAMMKCFRGLYENADNASVVAQLDVPAKVKADCSRSFKSTNEINLCVRESMAGLVLAKTLTGIHNAQVMQEITLKHVKLSLAPEPAFETPSNAVVAVTYDGHPDAQCRLDTFLAGSICGASYTQEFGRNDPITGACATEKGDRYGFRPTCWYKPRM